MDYKNMSIREKVKYTIGLNVWQTYGDDTLRVLTMSDGPSGIRRQKGFEKNQDNMTKEGILPSTLYPSAHVLASTFNQKLAERFGRSLGTECQYYGIDVLLGPGINIKRLANGGRNFEYYSEDPLLSGVMGGWVIKGIQHTSTGACLKHFIANNQESERHRINAVIDEQSFYETYLYAFRQAITIGNPWLIMVAYNKFNGEYCTVNQYLLEEILLKYLNYHGLVISDWGAVHQPSDAVKYGIDVIMPGPNEEFAKDVRYSADNGFISERRFDQIIRKLQKLDKMTSIKSELLYEKEPHRVAYEIAKQGMVLLENNGLLPLSRTEEVYVVGDLAKEPKVQGRGSSFVHPKELVTPLMAFEREGVNYRYFEQVPSSIPEGKIVCFFAGTDHEAESEGYDRENLHIEPAHYKALKKLLASNAKVVLILQAGGIVTLGGLEKSLDAYLYAGFGGEAVGEALLDLLYGKVSPSGRVAETFPVRYKDTPAYVNYPASNNEAIYGEGSSIGYTYYHHRQMPVAYPFGYGLMYGNVEYQLTSWRLGEHETGVTFRLINQSDYELSEVVQIYVEPVNTRNARRLKRLRSFKRVTLAPHEVKEISMKVMPEDFEYFDIHFKEWYIDGGEYKITVGKNAFDEQFSTSVTMASTKVFNLSSVHTLREWIGHPLGKKAIESTLKAFNQVMAVDQNNNLIKMALDMPIESIAQIAANELDVPKQQILDVLQEFLDDYK